MNTCKQIRENLTAYICGELSLQETQWIAEHLETCGACRDEYNELAQLLGSIDESDRETEELMDRMDWGGMASEIAGRVRAEAETQKHLAVVNGGNESHVRKGGWKIVAPAMTAVFFLGLFLGYLLFYSPGVNPVTQTNGPVTDDVSLARLELALNQKEVLDYLKQTQLMLTDIMNEEPVGANHAMISQPDLGSERARGLLEKNRYVSQNLDRSQLGSAQNVLEKTRFLLTEIVMMDRLTPEQLQLLRDYVRQERLFLKIRLVEKELSRQNGM